MGHPLKEICDRLDRACKLLDEASGGYREGRYEMVVKVFSATKARDRESLGEKVTEWLRTTGLEVIHKTVTQSSDREFHCLSIILFCR